MNVHSAEQSFVLFVGDLACFVAGLWLALLVRYQALPTTRLFLTHLGPFFYVFLIWILVFFIFDLYAKQRVVFASKLVVTILKVYATNAVIAVLFFYFVPAVGIAPKINLFITLGFSLLLVLGWRLYLIRLLFRSRAERAAILGEGEEFKELKHEIESNPKYNLKLMPVHTSHELAGHGLEVIIADLDNPQIQSLVHLIYEQLLAGVRVVPLDELYEEVFDRVPLSVIREGWLLKNISNYPKPAYDFFKRVMDIAIALPLFIISLIFYPFVALAIKLDDGGPVFIKQIRVGMDGRQIKILKFRSMSQNETDLNVGLQGRQVTRVGNFLRISRLDEFPQLWSVLSGDQSLIGPRPELPSGVTLYEQEIPYYSTRHLIKPGLSGWAQIYHDDHPHHGVGLNQTKDKLSYDLYYLKHRSFILDLKIALKTIKKLLSFAGI